MRGEVDQMIASMSSFALKSLQILQIPRLELRMR